MSLYLVNPAPPDLPDNPAADAPPLVSDSLATCVESRDSLNHIRSAVFSKFTPTEDFDVILAESTASALWFKSRYANLATDVLDIKIQEEWKATNKTNPKATPRYRTAKAFEALHESGLLASADNLLHRSHSRARGETREIARFTRK